MCGPSTECPAAEPPPARVTNCGCGVGWYPGQVSETRSRSLRDLSEDLRDADPATADDVTVLLDGRRLDSKAKVLSWLAEVEADRAAGRSALDELA